MNKKIRMFPFLIGISFLLCGCGAIGDKAMNGSIIYGAAAFLSALLLAGYCCLVKNRSSWFILLFTSVLVVNVGYYLLSVSQTLDLALTANRISYFGAVFLPASMQMIIINVAGLHHKKWLPYVLLIISCVVFAIAASPGYSTIYYQEVSLSNVNGVTVLDKEYGPLHCIYLFYLVIHFSIMIATVVHAIATKRLRTYTQALFLLVSVFVNICVWLIEQLVHMDFEFLSISYIISELFLLSVYLMLQDVPDSNSSDNLPVSNTPPCAPESPAQEENTQSNATAFCAGILELTKTELTIYHYYLDGKTTKEIMQALNIKENTLKYHNKNIYSKLGVRSRKQLVEIAKSLPASKLES